MKHKNDEAVLDRLLLAIGEKKYSALADVLEVKPQSVSDAKTKKKVPLAWAVTIAAKYAISLDWILFGLGPSKRCLEQSTEDAASVRNMQSTLELRIAELEKENKLLKEANESHKDALWACKIAIEAMQVKANAQ